MGKYINDSRKITMAGDTTEEGGEEGRGGGKRKMKIDRKRQGR